MLPTPHRVAVLAFDAVVAFDLATPCHVFATAGADRYAVAVCGEGASDAGPFAITPGAGLDALERAQTVIVPGVETTETRPLVTPAVAAALRAAAGNGARVASICTGAFVLAEAGLLDGRRATTHWAYAEELRRRFPAVTVTADVLYVDDGDVLTSAGVASGIDLCLHLLRADHGAAVANRVARRMVVPPHRDGGQAQYVERPLPDDRGTTLAGTRAWMLDHLAEPLTVETCAAHAHVSPRTFARHFRAESRTTPLRWLHDQRVLAARQLLETTGLGVDAVAAAVGFGTATGLREHFRRATGTTPTAYRATFRGRTAA